VGAGIAVLCVGASGCGEEGVAEGATVTVYVSAPLSGEDAAEGGRLCAGAQRELARNGARAGEVRVRAICLDDTGGGSRWTLVAVGANARRASEDSTTVGYIGEPDPAAARFSRPILESAGIAQLTGMSGAAAMSELLDAIRAAGGSGGLRESVDDALGVDA
jgi:branched-chain amino acid transport system substrate-binding protein